MRIAPLRIALVVGVAASCGSDGTAPPAPKSVAGEAEAAAEAPRLLENLGDHHRPITTQVELAQRYFDQGLILTYGFNHAAAIASFEAAAALDPECAMCFWGIALAHGPNINAPMGPDAGKAAYDAVQKARGASGASPRERAYIEALATRYAAEPPADRAGLDRAYAEAMRGVREADPEDVDAAVLLAEALMNLYPWNYWTNDAKPREHTLETLELLEWAMERDPQHVGANHYYIHAVEEFFPERAEHAADRLGSIAPDAGHLVHMPSHIYWRVGRYDDALEINREAAAADEQYFAWCKPGAFYRASYYPHNVHFLWSAAAAGGRSELTLSTARKLESVVADRVATFAFLEEFMSIPALTLARFGRWDVVLGQPRPDDARRDLNGIWHYTRGLAFARKGDTDSAATELAALGAVTEEPAVQELVLAGGTASAAALLGIGRAHLAGEIAHARGETDAAIEALERAVALQDALVYMEPPPWYFPTRQALGAILLDVGRPADAEAVYRKDLEQYRRNGWSLYGLTRSLQAQDKDHDASIAKRGFDEAWAHADVELTTSRY